MTTGLEGVPTDSMIRVTDVIAVVDMLMRLSRLAVDDGHPDRPQPQRGYRA